LRGEYELTEEIRELSTSGKRMKALELTREWADVRNSEFLSPRTKRHGADTGLR